MIVLVVFLFLFRLFSNLLSLSSKFDHETNLLIRPVRMENKDIAVFCKFPPIRKKVYPKNFYGFSLVTRQTQTVDGERKQTLERI